jgi:drug/metabolite transporter (DMT)-like permease
MSSAQHAANRRGILAMVAAMASFILNDALVKYTSQTLPAAQLIFIRGLMACVVVLLAARAMGALPHLRELRQLAQRWVVVRACADAMATMIYLTAMFNMPLANATAINLAGPLFITLFAACFMGEQVRASRWVAIGLGFLGVLLVIQPKADGFNSYALLCLLGTVFHATRDLLTRRIPVGVPVILITLATTLSIVLLSGAVSLVQGWRPFGWRELGMLAVASVLLSSGYYLLVYAMRQGEISLVTPFRYSTLLFAVLIGFAVWGDVPNTLAWCGIALLVGSGLFILQRESARVRKAGAVPLAPGPVTASLPLDALGPAPMDATTPSPTTPRKETRAR